MCMRVFDDTVIFSCFLRWSSGVVAGCMAEDLPASIVAAAETTGFTFMDILYGRTQML